MQKAVVFTTSAILFLCGPVHADIVYMGKHQGDFQIWGDIEIAGHPTISGAHASANVAPALSGGSVSLDTDNVTATYDSLSATVSGRQAVRPFRVTNGLNPDKQFYLRTTINETFDIYSQVGGAVTLPVTVVREDSAVTGGLTDSQIVASPVTITVDWELEGPTESASGTFSLSGITPTGANIGNGGYPYGRFFRLARDSSGAIIEGAYTRKTYMFGDLEYDFDDQFVFSAVVDDESFTFNATRATFSENVLVSSKSVPEPSCLGVIVLVASYCSVRRRDRSVPKNSAYIRHGTERISRPQTTLSFAQTRP